MIVPPYFWEFHVVLVVSVLIITFYYMVKEEDECDMCGDPVPRGHPMCDHCYWWLKEGQK